MIVFWHFNEFSDGTPESVSKSLDQFIELVHLWPKHMVCITTCGKLWSVGHPEGVSREWENRAKLMHNTLLSFGVNVVDITAWT